MLDGSPGMKVDERVLCIPTPHFRAVGVFHGLRLAEDGYRSRLLDATQYSFRPRSEVETDSEFKQLIPYVVLKSGDQLFHYQRGVAGTEKRLQALRSIGIGGHISEEDAVGGADPYRTGMMREVVEEVAIDCEYTERLIGFINDDRTLVGSVHLGVIHLFELTAPLATPREAALAGAGWSSVTQLQSEHAQFETWSQFFLDELTNRRSALCHPPG